MSMATVRISLTLISLGWFAATTGCTHDRPLDVRLGHDVHLPDRAAVLFLIDGLDRTRMEAMLATGDLPNIRDRLVARGTIVENAVAALPSITYANTTTLLTGQFPGTHGILGNKWFDRYRLILHDYTTTETYRNTDNDFRAPTIYEMLECEPTVSIQCAVRRGTTRVIDNWATSGINWFFGGFNETDKLIAIRFELIAEMARKTGRWPTFVNAYFPGVDETGHRFGADSPQYADALRNMDEQIGRILNAYEEIGLLNRTVFVLTSDHGHVPIAPNDRLDLVAWLRENAELRVSTATPAGSYEDRYAEMEPVDAFVINGGNRRAAIHLRGAGGWNDRPDAAQVTELLDRAGGLWNDPLVGLIALRDGNDSALVLSGHGRARIVRTQVPDAASTLYELVSDQGDPLGYRADEILRRFIDSGPHDSRSWLRATAESQFPDFVPQIVEMFDSPHAGDAVVFAAESASFDSANRGGHGSALRRDMIVPMIWCGPDIPPGGRIDAARTADVTPTLLDLLSAPPPDLQMLAMDGTSLTDALRAAQTD